MSAIADFKTSINRAKNIEGFANLLNDTDAKLTFWGCRKVITESEKEISLDFVAKKAISLINPLLNDWIFTPPDRSHISDIQKKINHFYQKTDNKLEESFLLTKIFYLFRNVFSIFYSTRKQWDDLCQIDPANFYTLSQFTNAFPASKLPSTPDKTPTFNRKKRNLYLPAPSPPYSPQSVADQPQPCTLI